MNEEKLFALNIEYGTMLGNEYIVVKATSEEEAINTFIESYKSGEITLLYRDINMDWTYETHQYIKATIAFWKNKHDDIIWVDELSGKPDQKCFVVWSYLE